MKTSIKTSPLLVLGKRLGANWITLKTAAECAESKRQALWKDLKSIESIDTSIVVLGSLGRNEFTEASDIDWTLLIDGPVDPRHLEIKKNIDNIIKGQSKPVGPEGLFGNLTFSHELVH